MQSADEGYETASETISEGSSVDPRDETTSVDEEAPADGNLPGA